MRKSTTLLLLTYVFSGIIFVLLGVSFYVLAVSNSIPDPPPKSVLLDGKPVKAGCVVYSKVDGRRGVVDYPPYDGNRIIVIFTSSSSKDIYVKWYMEPELLSSKPLEIYKEE